MSEVSAERLGPLDPSLVLPLSYALSRPMLSTALEGEASVFPAACVAAVALRRLERSVLRDLATAPQHSTTPYSTRLLRWLVSCALQLLGASVLWTMAEWGALLVAPQLAAWCTAMTLQSYVGIVAASLTALSLALPARMSIGEVHDWAAAVFLRASNVLVVARQARCAAAAARASTETPLNIDEGSDGSPFPRRSLSIASPLVSPLMSPQKLLDGGGDRRDVVVYNERFGFRRKFLLPMLSALPFNIGDGILAGINEVRLAKGFVLHCKHGARAATHCAHSGLPVLTTHYPPTIPFFLP